MLAEVFLALWLVFYILAALRLCLETLLRLLPVLGRALAATAGAAARLWSAFPLRGWHRLPRRGPPVPEFSPQETEAALAEIEGRAPRRLPPKSLPVRELVEWGRRAAIEEGVRGEDD